MDIATECVCSLKEAKHLLKLGKPEIVFIDNHLPDGLGVDFIQNIKALLPLVKIVMITAHDTPVDRDRALKEGADYFLGKPFSREKILGILETYVA
jgi:DNA-binding response OmpR family regulator